jgi:hypothetical protein
MNEQKVPGFLNLLPDATGRRLSDWMRGVNLFRIRSAMRTNRQEIS